ncbi:alpha-tocopherol transfer protein-like [Amblyomma americanum]
MSGVYVKKCFDDMIDSSQGAPSAHLQRIAHEELGETPEKRREALEEIRRLLEAEPDLNSRRDEEFLLRFLRVRKYDVESALRCVRNYYRNQASSGSVYDEFLPSRVLPAAHKLYMVMPQKDIRGRPIFLHRAGMWMPDEVPYKDLHRAGLICLEHMACDPVAQTLGIVLLIDFAGFTADKVFSLSIGLMRRAFEYIQDCMPMRMKAVHIVRQSYAFDLLFALVRPFMSAKIIKRVRFHGENFERLHEEVPPEALPEEYGGRGPPLEVGAFWKEVEANEASFAANNRFGCCTSDVDVLSADNVQPQECTSL